MSAIPLKRIEGKYEILEKLGEGGMGAVYKVRHRLLDALRVIKMMRPQLVEDESLKGRFLREARVAIQLRHPNIAQLYDFTVDDDGIAFIVMEYIQGLTLESLIASSGPLSLGLGLEIAQQSLQALAYLHDKGFIHRDISPDNLMLTTGPHGEPQVKLIDLGIAKTLDGGITGYRTQSGTFLGKVRYAPPEQFNAEGAAAMDARGDLYSFGVVLYELLTGHYPIQGRDASSLIAGHLFWPPMDFATSDPGGTVPPGLREVVVKALAKKPQERFASAQDFARALDASRAPADVAAGELQRVFARAAAGRTRHHAPDPGSTQDRLDLQFGLQTTPSPARLVEVKEEPRPRSVEARQREVAALVERFEAKVLQGDFRGAERLLFNAEVDYPGEDFAALHERLGEERQRDLAAKAEARRRAERIAAAIAEAEERLARGEAQQAGEVLDDTVATFDDDTLSGELRARIGKLRREVENAERTALLAAARERLAAGDLAAALERVGQVERLDPESAAARSLREEIEAEEHRRQAEAREKAEREAEEARRAAEREAEEARQQAEREAAEARRLVAAARQAERAAAAARQQAEREAEERRRLAEEQQRLAEEWQRTERETRVAALLASGRRSFAAGDLEGALDDLGAAEELAAESAAAAAVEREVRELRRQIEDERGHREEEARREAERAAAIAAIDALLEKGDLGGAASLLPGAVAAFGDDTLLRHRSQRIEGLRRRTEETRQQDELAAVMAAIDGCLERGQLEEAARLLPGAVARFGGTPALRERWERLEVLRGRATLAALLTRAGSLLESGDLDRAARTLRQALDRDPGNSEAEALLRQVRERQ